VDLRKRFGAPGVNPTDRLEKLVIVSVRGRIVALKVDRIIGELRVPANGVRPAPSMLRPTSTDDGVGETEDFFTGVCRVDDEMVFVVKLETIIDPRIGSLQPDTAPPPPHEDGHP
jgi:purine-binding chemotaxis protein CheW